MRGSVGLILKPRCRRFWRAHWATGSDSDAVTVYDSESVDEDKDDWGSAALVVHREPILYTEEPVAEYGRIGTLRKAVTERRRYG